MVFCFFICFWIHVVEKPISLDAFKQELYSFMIFSFRSHFNIFTDNPLGLKIFILSSRYLQIYPFDDPYVEQHFDINDIFIFKLSLIWVKESHVFKYSPFNEYWTIFLFELFDLSFAES